jgi:AraC-like DNA-binding protein
VHFRVGQADDLDLVATFQTLCRMVEQPSAGAASDGRDGVTSTASAATEPLVFEETLVAFLTRALRAVGDAARPPPRYCRKSVHLARSFVLENFQCRLTLRRLAALGGQSPWHFARSFRAEVGLSPARYVRGVRAGKALEFLRKGFRPREAAVMAGFCDQAQLTRALRHEFGFTPASFYRGAGTAGTPLRS